MNKKVRGFTLVEIIVVVFIVAIMGLAAVMTLGGGTTSERARDSASQLKSLLSAAEQEAILTQRQIGIVFHEKSYSFAQFDSTKQNWQPLDKDRVLGSEHKLPRDVELLVTVEGREVMPTASMQTKPQLIVTSQGNQTPFAVGISHKGALQYWLVGHSSGTVEIVDATD
jgi:type II secretion system protein H